MENRSDSSEKQANTSTIREHFPISTVTDGTATRREFLKVLTLTSGAIFTGTVGLAVAGAFHTPQTYAQVKIGELGQLKANQSTTFAYPTANDPCLLIHLGENQYVAYSQKCTHLACPVYWEAAHHRIECPCHEGAFDGMTGAVLGGPPQRPLPRIQLKIDGQSIYAVGVDLNAPAGEG